MFFIILSQTRVFFNPKYHLKIPKNSLVLLTHIPLFAIIKPGGDFMLYQKLLSGKQPYSIINAKKALAFQKHRHPEIEFSYCVSGSYPIIINNEPCILKEGELSIVGSMVSHEIPKNHPDDCHVLVIEVGPVLLTGYFDMLARITSENPILKVDKNNNKELYNLFKEIISLKEKSVDFLDLAIKGNLYKICAYILREFESISSSEQKVYEIRSVANIEKALELICEKYNSHLSLEEVAEFCGYSKNNFCKIFKRITGDTFHNVLNDYRIKMACELLDKTNYSVETIATEVGFADSKTLCRVFKAIKGMTTGQYRKREK